MECNVDRAGKQSIITFFLVITVFINVLILFMIAAPAGHFDLINVVQPVELPDTQLQMNLDLGGEATVDVAGGDETEHDLIMELQWKLEETKIEGDYEIEAYREYEVYKNAEGKVIETRATEHYEYLRYWRYR